MKKFGFIIGAIALIAFIGCSNADLPLKKIWLGDGWQFFTSSKPNEGLVTIEGVDFLMEYSNSNRTFIIYMDDGTKAMEGNFSLKGNVLGLELTKVGGTKGSKKLTLYEK